MGKYELWGNWDLGEVRNCGTEQHIERKMGIVLSVGENRIVGKMSTVKEKKRVVGQTKDNQKLR
jgi:hypothetical protein